MFFGSRLFEITNFPKITIWKYRFFETFDYPKISFFRNIRLFEYIVFSEPWIIRKRAFSDFDVFRSRVFSKTSRKMNLEILWIWWSNWAMTKSNNWNACLRNEFLISGPLYLDLAYNSDQKYFSVTTLPILQNGWPLYLSISSNQRCFKYGLLSNIVQPFESSLFMSCSSRNMF